MPRTTTSDRGAIVLVKFVFADEKGAKRPPALILSTEEYHTGRREVVVAAITSNVERLLVGDYRIAQWREAGLPFPSVVTGIIRTIKRDMIDGSLWSPALLLRFYIVNRHSFFNDSSKFRCRWMRTVGVHCG